MLKTFMAIILGFVVTIPSSNNPADFNMAQAVVSRVEGNCAVVEFSKNNTFRALDILIEDINGEVSEGMNIPMKEVEGKFYDDMICTDYYGVERIFYQFKSDDDTVWWFLNATEIGHIPNNTDKYILYYTDNGTTEESQVCDCLPEWECECYLYDDIFLHIERKG